MIRSFWFLAAAVALSGCAGLRDAPSGAHPAVAPVTVRIIAFNDFHGALEPAITPVLAPGADGKLIKVPAGGAAYLMSAIQSLRNGHPNSVTVAAGDLIGATPLPSALALDEPTIDAMNMMGVEYSAVGNHEFDKGRRELLRMAHGGCATYTNRQPCRLEPFRGARFSYLAANTLGTDGKTLFPAYAIKLFGRGRAQVRVAFIGLTLKGTPDMVAAGGVADLRFTDEADAANALVPELRRAGADAIVVLIHQGGETRVGYNDKSCVGLSGDILPILDRLDPAISVVVSGHTHNSYICDYGRKNPAKPFLLTSAAKNGTELTDIELTIDPVAHRVIARSADNLIVQNDGYTIATGTVLPTSLYPRFAPAPEVAALVARAVEAARPLAARPAGRLGGSAARADTGEEGVIGDMVADSFLAATRDPAHGGARFAVTNPGGLRADLVPAADGTISFGQIFAVQPFGNMVSVVSLTGREILALLDEQVRPGAGIPLTLLQPSANFRYRIDPSAPAEARVSDVTIDGVPLDPDATYRVATNSFLAAGGDGFPTFKSGTGLVAVMSDVDAFEAYIGGPVLVVPPAIGRIRVASH